jgi:hypothetical protein
MQTLPLDTQGLQTALGLLEYTPPPNKNAHAKKMNDMHTTTKTTRGLQNCPQKIMHTTTKGRQ